MMRAASVACLAFLLLSTPARAQLAFDPTLLAKVMHLVLAQPTDYPEGVPRSPSLVVLLAFMGADGAILDTSLIAGSGNPVLDARSRELVGAHRWTPLQVDGTSLGSLAMLGIVWTPPGMALPTPEEQRELLNMMGGQLPPP